MPLENVKFRPNFDRLVVRRLDPPEKIGSIVLPDQSKEPPQRGVVIATGPGARDVNGHMIPMDVVVGDHVLFGKYAGLEMQVGGEPVLLLNEVEVMGVVR